MRHSNEVDIMRAASKLKLFTGVTILSWDNVTTKGLFHFDVDFYGCWNKSQAKDLKNYHQVPSNLISVTGAPFFDKWQNTKLPSDEKMQFCNKYDIDPQKNIILFLGSSSNIAENETWVVEEVIDLLKNSENQNLRNTQIVFRPHPANWENKQGLKSLDVLLIPETGSLPDTDDNTRCFKETMSACDCVIGINTSGMVDAIVLDKPVFSPLIKKYNNTQTHAKHFRRLMTSRAVSVSQTIEKLHPLLCEFFDGEDIAKQKRHEFRELFIYPRGAETYSGQNAADDILFFFEKSKKIHKKQADVTSKPVVGLELANFESTSLLKIINEIELNIHEGAKSDLYTYYLSICQKIKNIMKDNSYSASKYWAEEVIGFDYLFEASPLVVNKIREHCYHITGERSYNYRTHHVHKAIPFINKLEELKKLDRHNLFIPESEMLGGFGHPTDYGRVNIDTLKFYEFLIGLERSGNLPPETDERLSVVEIGSGWGGFTYQFKSLRPNSTIFLIDLPPTFMFAATYLKGMFPDSTSVILSEENCSEVFKNWSSYDFVFVSANHCKEFSPSKIDLGLNMVSFQEMTTSQVESYVNLLADLNCKRLYSLNRDRSPHNQELTLVSEILATRYDVELVKMLDFEYHSVSSKRPLKLDYEDLKVSQYRHLSCSILK